MELHDKTIVCKDCGAVFTFTTGEQEFFLEHGFSEPKICRICRNAKKDLKFRNRDAIRNYTIGTDQDSKSSILYIPVLNEIPAPKILIDDISILNSSLLEKVSKEPSIIHELSSRQFEEMVCDLLSKQGYNVTLTQKTKDGGKDIIVVEKNFLGGFLFYIECKRYRSDRPVGVCLVRDLYGVISADNATAGMLVTSSYFSKSAIAFQENVKHRMDLLDFKRLVKKIQEVCSDN